MAVKMLKYPKKPKATASVQVLENFLAKVKEIDKKNAARKAENTKRENLKKKVASVGRAK